MKRRLGHAAVLAVAGFGLATADPGINLPVTLAVHTPSIDVSPRRPGREFLELPALEYRFDVGTRCGDDWVPESLSLSVADSRVVIGAGELSGSESRQVSIEVPARQLAPVAVHDFCMAGEAPAGIVPGRDPPLTVRAVLSAHASLLCRSESEVSITYVSQPLDVTLACRPQHASDPAN